MAPKYEIIEGDHSKFVGSYADLDEAEVQEILRRVAAAKEKLVENSSMGAGQLPPVKTGGL